MVLKPSEGLFGMILLKASTIEYRAGGVKTPRSIVHLQRSLLRFHSCLIDVELLPRTYSRERMLWMVGVLLYTIRYRYRIPRLIDHHLHNQSRHNRHRVASKSTHMNQHQASKIASDCIIRITSNHGSTSVSIHLRIGQASTRGFDHDHLISVIASTTIR